MKRVYIGIGLAVCSVAANASTVKLTGTGLGDAVTISGLMNARVFAGQYEFKDSAAGNLTTYCADLLHTIRIGQSWQQSVLNTQAQGTAIKLAGNIVANGAASATTNDKAAGLQLAVWEELYDGGSTANFAKGSFKASTSSSVLNWANYYYNLRNTSANALLYKVNAGCYGQNQLGCVPEPASIAALLIGGSALLRRRRAKKA